jgi:drug/metabolite transporter (DMT)-like permease
MSILSALGAAFCNALNVVTQHIASTRAPARSRGWRIVGYLLRSPMWLFGWAALAGAFVFQALALYWGQLSVVQPLLVTELVFALVLRRLWIHQTIRGVTWGAATVTCAGLALFLLVAEPHGGNDHPTSLAWVSAIVTSAAAVAVLALVAQFGSAGRRAQLYGCATAIMWSLVAVFMKSTTDSFARFGAKGAFSHWPVYALALSGLVAEVLNQVTLHVGPLSLSQPFLVIVDPLVSIVLSVWIFGEHFTPNAGALTVGTLSFAAMCAGVAMLTKTAPLTVTRAAER